MKITLVIVALSFFTCCTETRKYEDYTIKGTLIIVGPTSDGFIISADTRGSFSVKGHQKPVAYVDSVAKIFKIKDFVIAISGINSLNGITYPTIIDSFNKVYPGKLSLRETFTKFRDFVYHEFTTYASDVKHTTFFSGGYIDGKPTTIIIDSVGTHFFVGMVASAEKAAYYFDSIPWPQTCEKLSSLFEKITYKYALQYKLETEVGGPISIVKIDKLNKVYFIKNDFSKFSPADHLEVAYNVLEGKTNVHYLFPEAKELLFKELQSFVDRYK